MLPESLINPSDPPERQAEKLLAIANVLMRRVEQATDDSGAAYAHFQRAAFLEDQVRERTRDLERAMGVINDTNARLAEANRQTEAARQNLANAIETIQEGFALFDANDLLVMCNSRFGMHIDDVIAQLRPGLRFEDYVDMVSRSRFLALPPGMTPAEWAVQRHRRHADQHVIFNVRLLGDRWVQVSEHRTQGGGTVILQTDVTDIIRLERHERGRMLDDQARVIRATLDHLNQGVAIFDAKGCLLWWNERLSSLLAIPLSRLRTGLPLASLIDRFAADLGVRSALTGGQLASGFDPGAMQWPLTYELRRGPNIILDVFAQGLPDGGFVMSFTDVSAERGAIEALSRANETLEARVAERTLELEDALLNAERANASRSRFVAAASHDLLQPLSAAKLFVSLIEDENIAPTSRDALVKAQNALRSVEGILGALLDISKLESGRASVTVGPVALDRMLTQLRDEFAALAAAKNLTLRILPSRDVVTSDPAYLRRILQNLIGNAIRYTAEGRVVVAARRRGSHIRLEIHDTGPGIPEAERENIFKEFHRLNARASASEGMGLGLAIVERACALLGHELTLDSRVGSGTTFAVSLPLSDAGLGGEDQIASAPRSGGETPAEGASVGVVLLVENDSDLRRAIGLLLEKWGISVLDVASGEEGLALIDDIGILPDFMLVDHQLGEGISGVEFITEMRRRHGAIPTRIITANRSAQVRDLCEAAGISMLMKPIDPKALSQALFDAP
ncbi:MAG: hypothetical protein RLZZ528_1398 [Pseudomonadota bacterium]|jgi:signal transduction histidine kinase/CheY-like chemotaxis protein